MQQTEKYWNLINRFVLVAIVIMAGVGVVLAFGPKVNELKQYQEINDDLQVRIDSVYDEINDFKEKQRRFSSDRVFVERVAHEVGYVYPGEIMYQVESLDPNEALR